jgi:hypothetical protein
MAYFVRPANLSPHGWNKHLFSESGRDSAGEKIVQMGKENKSQDIAGFGDIPIGIV